MVLQLLSKKLLKVLILE